MTRRADDNCMVCPHYREDDRCNCIGPQDGVYPSWCCQRCGEEIGWLGRALEWLLGWAGWGHGCKGWFQP